MVFILDFYYLDIKELQVKFEYDPSVDVHTDFKDFFNYFATKHVFIEIYDAEKVIPIGYTKISLKDLLRQGKQASHSQPKEADIYDVLL